MLMAALVGLIVAFVASMPVAGPVAALVVRHGLEGHVKSALMLGVGTGLAEGVYAFLALWGFSTFLADYPIVVPISKAVAAVILVALGIWFTRFVPQTSTAAAPAPTPGPSADAPGSLIRKARRRTTLSLEVGHVMAKGAQAERLWQSFGVGFSVTFLNPTLLATWAAAATTIMSMDLFPVEPAYAWPFAIGVVIGASSWFALLVWLLSRLRHRFSPLTLQRVIRAMGWGLVGLGAWFALAFILYMVR